MPTRFLVGRLLQAIPTLIAITLLSFLLIHMLPGDPVVALLGEAATETQIQELRSRLGLDRPLPEQYVYYMVSLMRGDLGRSIQSRQPVSAEIGRRLGATFHLAGAAMVVATVLGLATGVVAAWRSGSLTDLGITVISLLGVCIPSFWLALLLILVFSVQLGWLAPVGYNDWRSLILPSLTLAAAPMGLVARLARGTMVEVLDEDYIRTARAKGLVEWTVILRHALRNAFIPTLTVIGLQFGILLTGAIITETVFAWPGIGRLTVESLLNRDYPVVQGLILLFAVIFIGLNLLVDLLYGVLDPRVRVGS